jgi:hypothetical protein
VTNDWWHRLTPVEVPIECAGETHRLRWEAGSLFALDHADAEGERALAALGGDRHECIGMLDAWARHQYDLRLLVLATRGAGDPIRYSAQSALPHPGQWHGVVPGPHRRPVAVAPTPPVIGSAGHTVMTATSVGRNIGPVRGGGPIPGAPPQPDDLMALLALGGSLAERLTAGVAAHWAERLTRGEPEACNRRASLVAALYGRVICTTREWLGEPDLELELNLIDNTRTPAIARPARGMLTLSLPFEWLWTVWACSLAVILGRFTLAVIESDDDAITLVTADPSITDLRPVTIRLGDAAPA